MNDLAKKIKVYGVIGIIGVCFTIIADIAYNEFQGNELGGALYISFLMLFSFPLWWGGIWVIYQGLKPAGPMWSLIPCLVFAFYTSTVNVFYHSCYPFWAALRDKQSAATGETLKMLNDMEVNIRQYTHIMNNVDNVLQILICVWMMIAILLGKTYFPKWMVCLIPIVPTILALLINVFCEGFMACVGPYLACVPMLFLFSIATYLLYKKFKM